MTERHILWICEYLLVHRRRRAKGKKFHFINLNYNSTLYKMKQMESRRRRIRDLFKIFVIIIQTSSIVCQKIWRRRNFWHWLKRHISKFTFFCVCCTLNEWWWMQSLIKFHLLSAAADSVNEWLQKKIMNNACWLARKQTIDKFFIISEN